MNFKVLPFCLFLLAASLPETSLQAAATVQLTETEQTLGRLINEYRQSKGLPAVPLSSSLSYVAQIHAWDTLTNHPDTGTDAAGKTCNGHSWSNKGTWTPVCFTGLDGQHMWSKPRELTTYTANGFEISAGPFGSTVSPELALESWKQSAPHNDVILNQGPWNQQWKAMGVGIYQGYVHVWFGEANDPAGVPKPGNLDPNKPISKEKFYRLKNFTLEAGNKCLEGNQLASGASQQGAAFMDNCQNVSGQAWYFIPTTDGYYKVTNAFLASQNKCLEGNRFVSGAVAGGAAFMADCQDVTGQKWKMTPQGGHGYLQLTTQFQELEKKCLEANYLAADAKVGGPAFLGDCQNFSRQLWILEEI
ncbi:MAG TPA: CAP domain-containing protein [Oligoflexus sp.]|uniref:CAP domain-containing protein n=1 Tax=Oligoflexus sp. TaxID=1971216 RepID=UPI002D323EDA|nr:CAP domain-containing protein [Oligoflexus sp.]HYX36136.1 CAP domain-containing protein [Oligoflexus sp.]